MKRSLLYGFITAVCFLQTACFEWLDASRKVASTADSTSLISSAQFKGAVSASNKVTGVLISWSAVTDSSLVKSYNVYRISGTKKTLLSSLAPSLTSYMDGTVVWGTIYTYQVKAVDINGIEDSNTATVKSLSWAGISAVTASSRTALTVSIANTATVVDEVRIYGQLGVGGNKILLATVGGSDTEVTVSGLRIGYPYIISAQAYVSSLGKEDGNEVVFSTSTLTVGYDNDGSDSSQWANVMQVRAFGEAPAAPIHPTTAAKSPQSRVVELVFNSFSTVGSSTKYVVTRVIDGEAMDSSATATCTDSTNTSCLVCGNVTASDGVVVCRDTQVAASPAKYRYSLSMIQTDATSGDSWIEPLPSDSEQLQYYSVLVPIPPKNMVLVQRDAANYEMCLQLNKNPDPSRHNRCLYTGLGAVPYSTGNNKPALTFDSGYYDFGYNLFVDRWQMACNWTSAARGGMCGTNHTSGDCIGYDGSQGSPASSQGKVGDVWYRMTGQASPGSSNLGICFIATSANSDGSINWAYAGYLGTNPTSYPNSSSQLNAAFSNDPGYYDSTGVLNTNLPGKKGKAIYLQNAATGNQICKSNVDENYGPKRLPRKRESIVYSAPAILSAELYTVGSYSNFTSKILVSGGAHPNTYGMYGCDHGTATPGDTYPSSLAEMLDHSNYPQYDGFMSFKSSSNSFYYGGVGAKAAFAIGAVQTVDCQSRYGVQDFMEEHTTSDIAYYNASASGYPTTGLMSPYDDGNRDMLGDIGGSSTGYVISNSTNTSSSLYSLMTAFIPTLGLPIFTTSYSSEYLAKAQITQPYGLSILTPYTSSLSSGVYTAIMANRWSTSFREPPSSTTGYYNNGRTRCVLPAE